MTTEVGNASVDRDLHVLLQESTYQGMTDTEIDKIIAYKENLARESGEASILAAHSASIMAHLQELCQLERERQQLMLQSVLDLEIPWVTVAKEGTVNSNV